MDRRDAIAERGIHLEAARQYFRQLLARKHVWFDKHDRARFVDIFEERRWNQLHFAADHVIKKYFEELDSPF